MAFALTTYFISRHSGSVAWAQGRGLCWDQLLPHLDVAQIEAGDLVYGTLPVPLAAAVCAKGAAYWHLQLPVLLSDRGRELTAGDLTERGACFIRFDVKQMEIE
ncbi:CRISPR-associated protein Csx16 [Roseateles sp. GG27B]